MADAASSQTDPLLFDLSAEAVFFALALVISPVEFLAVIFALAGATTEGARPWGNTSPEFRRRLRWACWAGVVLCAVGLVSFALYRAELVVLAGAAADDGADTAPSGGVLTSTMPYVFIPIFAVSVVGASALALWSVIVGVTGSYILVGLIGLQRAARVVRFVVHLLDQLVDGFDTCLIALWDVLCWPLFGKRWDFLLGNRKILGKYIPRLKYCPRRPVHVRGEHAPRFMGTGIVDPYGCACKPSGSTVVISAARTNGVSHAQEVRPQSSSSLPRDLKPGVSPEALATSTMR